MSSSFEIVDRRGGNKEEIAPVALEESKAEWQDVRYCPTIIAQPNGLFVILGRAVGLRSDGRPFIADWAFPAIWPTHLDDWRPKAKERLDTFLNCDCLESSPCAIHKIYISQWVQQDRERLILESGGELPPALDALRRAEIVAQEKQKKSNLLVPRG